jgi:hypothetical protein
MKGIGKYILWFFALIGAAASVSFIYNFFKHQSEAKLYARNCLDIQTGMSFSEAKKIMGDYDRFEKSSYSEIWIEHVEQDSIRQYYLSYPTVFGGSAWPMIYFDPVTMKITKVICGE